MTDSADADETHWRDDIAHDIGALGDGGFTDHEMMTRMVDLIALFAEAEEAHSGHISRTGVDEYYVGFNVLIDWDKGEHPFTQKIESHPYTADVEYGPESEGKDHRRVYATVTVPVTVNGRLYEPDHTDRQ